MKPIAFIFLHPYLLWALAFLLVPVLIHLFAFKKFTKITFSDISLLKSVHQSGVAKKNIRDVLVLFSRLLFLFFLIICFAQPVERSKEELVSDKKLVSIYLDNSFSMGAMQNQLDLFTQAQYLAEEIISQYSTNDRFLILSNDYSSKDGRLLQKEEAKRAISEYLLSSEVKNISEIYKRQAFILEEHKEYSPVIYWISDFQGFTDTTFTNNSTYQINCIVVKPELQDNLYIDSVWFDSPIRKQKGMDELMVNVVNEGDEGVELLKVELNVNGKKYIEEVSISTREHRTIEFSYLVPDSQVIEGEVVINDHSLTFDNKYFFTYNLPKRIQVLSVSDQDQFNNIIKRVFKTDSSIIFNEIPARGLNKNVIQKTDLLVLGEVDFYSSGMIDLLKFAVSQKKGVLIVPSVDLDLASYNALSEEIEGVAFVERDTQTMVLKKVDEQSEFFKEVFDVNAKTKDNIKVEMPLLRVHYQMEYNKSVFRPILLKENSKPYLVGKGNLQYLASPLTDQGSDIAAHPLVVPLLYQAVFNSVFVQDIAFTIGKTASVLTSFLAVPPFELSNRAGFSVFPSYSFGGNVGRANVLFEDIEEAGFYGLKDGGGNINPVALNFDRRESKTIESQLQLLDHLAENNAKVKIIDGSIEDKTGIVNLVQGKTYWQYFLSLAVFFFILEMILLRFFSRTIA